MSIVIFGPQGCGKRRHGELLRRHFGMRSVVEAEDIRSREGLYADLSDPMRAARLRNRQAVILTDEEPPPFTTLHVRTLSFAEAMRACTP